MHCQAWGKCLLPIRLPIRPQPCTVLPITSFGAVVMASPCRAARVLSLLVGKIGEPRGALGKDDRGGSAKWWQNMYLG